MLLLTNSFTELVSTQKQNQLHLLGEWGELATVPEADPKEKKNPNHASYQTVEVRW